MIRYIEFVSDEWVGVNVEHKLQGFLLDRVPLIKKLKWRLFYNAKMIVGRYNNKHDNELLLPTYSYKLKYPYYEVGFGVENIFKFIRLDFVWRLNYNHHQYFDTRKNVLRDVPNFKIMFSFTTDF